MNDRNSYFDNGIFGGGLENHSASNNTASNSFSENASVAAESAHRKPRRPKRSGMGICLAVLLSVTLSFAAGFGGAYYALFLKESDSNVGKAPSKESLYSADPENLLDKAGSNASTYGSAGEDVFSVSQVVQNVADSVVVIHTTVVEESSFGFSKTKTGAGSGVIISETGYILTCHHVVEGATSIIVTLNSGGKYEASLVGSDQNSDLAVIRITPKEEEPLVRAEQGCSADLVVGERVVAIGNPLGTLGGTVTDGIISAKERTINTTSGVTMTLLQTNVAVNSGNSGGGLFNLDGKLIGIVNSKYSANGVEGLAFAIPIDASYTVQLDLIEFGYVRGVIAHGLQVQDVTVTSRELEFYKERYGIHESGVYVISSAYCDDLTYCDRIIRVGNTDVNTASEMREAFEAYRVGDTVEILASRDGVSFSTTIVLREYVPESAQTQGS